MDCPPPPVPQSLRSRSFTKFFYKGENSIDSIK